MAKEYLPKTFNEFISTPLFYFALIGWDPCDRNPRLHSSLYWRGFFYFGLINLFCFASSQVSVIFINSSSTLLEKSPAFVCVLYTFICYGKIVTLLLRKNELCELLDKMDQIFPRTLKQRKALKFRRFYDERTIVSRLTIYSSIITIYMYIVTSLLNSIHGFFKSGHFAYLPPIPMWQSFQIDSFLSYAALYFHQSYGIHVCNAAIMATDIFMIHLVILLCMFFTYISNEFSQMELRQDNEHFRRIKILIEFHDQILGYVLKIIEHFVYRIMCWVFQNECDGQ